MKELNNQVPLHLGTVWLSDSSLCNDNNTIQVSVVGSYGEILANWVDAFSEGLNTLEFFKEGKCQD